MLLARQMARQRPWACRSAGLLDFHLDCVSLGEALDQGGVEWDIRHIYREFNQVADALSNQAIDERESNGNTATW